MMGMSDMPPGNLSIFLAIKEWLVSPSADRRWRKISLLSEDELGRRGVKNIYLEVWACLVSADQLATAVERSSELNAKALQRSVRKAVKDQVKNAARAVAAQEKRKDKPEEKPAPPVGAEEIAARYWGPVGREDGITARYWRNVEWGQQMRQLAALAAAIKASGWKEDLQPTAERYWHENVVRESIEECEAEISAKLKAAMDNAAAAADLHATLSAKLWAERPKLDGRIDPYSETFFNVFFDLLERVTVFEREGAGEATKTPLEIHGPIVKIIAAALETLTKKEAYKWMSPADPGDLLTLSFPDQEARLKDEAAKQDLSLMPGLGSSIEAEVARQLEGKGAKQLLNRLREQAIERRRSRADERYKSIEGVLGSRVRDAYKRRTKKQALL